LYEVPNADALFEELDEIESFHGFGEPGSLYRRALVRARIGGGDGKLAWTYVFAASASGAPVIRSGDWRGCRHP
jgi:gamma-glutamylcyclotransferase (GGCT)/AIG2-like uncharacterized protein YtfP